MAKPGNRFLESVTVDDDTTLAIGRFRVTVYPAARTEIFRPHIADA